MSQCPLSAFRFNSSAAEAWVEHQWSNAQWEGEDVGTIIVGATLLCASLLVLLKGDVLTKPVFFLSGFTAAAVPSFAATDAMLVALPWSLSPATDCTLLVVLPLIFAVAAGLLNLWLLSLAFFTVGLISGGATGYYLYVLFLHTIPSPVVANGYTLCFCLTVLISGLVGGLAVLKAKHELLMLATSAAGAVGAIVGLDLVLLGRVDRRFLWLLDARTASTHLASPFVFGPVVVAVLLAVAGFTYQHKQRERRRLHAYAQPLITS